MSVNRYGYDLRSIVEDINAGRIKLSDAKPPTFPDDFPSMTRSFVRLKCFPLERRPFLSPKLVAAHFKAPERREISKAKSYEEALRIAQPSNTLLLDERCQQTYKKRLQRMTLGQRARHVMMREPRLLTAEILVLGVSPSAAIHPADYALLKRIQVTCRDLYEGRYPVDDQVLNSLDSAYRQFRVQAPNEKKYCALLMESLGIDYADTNQWIIARDMEWLYARFLLKHGFTDESIVDPTARWLTPWSVMGVAH